MRVPSDTHKKMMSAYQLLQAKSISIDTFEHIKTILKGLHPKVDEKLEICSNALNKLQKLQSGDVITLSAEGLSEDTEEKRKQKKALLFFINSIKNIKSEIKRINAEFTQANTRGNSFQNQVAIWGRIVGFAKGPFGIVTLIALVIVGFMLLHGHKMQNTAVFTSKTTQITNNRPITNVVGQASTTSPSQIKLSGSEPVESGCSQEGHIKSPSSYNKASITFDNQTAGDLKVYWIDFQGSRKFYNNLKAHSKYDQSTWIGHVWMVTNGAYQCIKLQSANAVEQMLVIN